MTAIVSWIGSAVAGWRARPVVERSMVYASVAIGGNAVMAGWKLWLVALSPSLVLAATALVNIALGAGKLSAVLAHRRTLRASTAWDVISEQHRTFRGVGVLVTTIAVLYAIASVVPLPERHHSAWTEPMAITIATLTFVEIMIAIPGAVRARRSREQMLEAVRLANLAGALLLVPLTQTALIAAVQPSGDGHQNTVGLVFGAAAALLGVSMVVRPWTGRLRDIVRPRTARWGQRRELRLERRIATRVPVMTLWTMVIGVGAFTLVVIGVLNALPALAVPALIVGVIALGLPRSAHADLAATRVERLRRRIDEVRLDAADYARVVAARDASMVSEGRAAVDRYSVAGRRHAPRAESAPSVRS